MQQPRLLALDAGNTNIKLGAWHGRAWAARRVLPTAAVRSHPEAAARLLEELAAGLRDGPVDGIVACSAVPLLNDGLRAWGREVAGDRFLMVDAALDLPLRIRYSPPAAVGRDRLMNALAARALAHGPAIVVDLGTATKYEAIADNGDYLGGAIAPGFGVSTDALFQAAPHLPRPAHRPPPHAIGQTTENALLSGMLLGYAGQVDGMVGRFRAVLGGETPVFLTGGWASAVRPGVFVPHVFAPDLTLDGLRHVWLHHAGHPDRRAQIPHA